MERCAYAWVGVMDFSVIGDLFKAVSKRLTRNKLNTEAASPLSSEFQRLQEELTTTKTQLTEANDALAAANEKIHELEKLSHTDPLTGLLNRRGCAAALSELVGTLKRKNYPVDPARPAGASDQTYVAVLFIDIDNFGLVNKTHGDQAGDAVLAGVAKTLRNTLRQGDIIARKGGEEIVVFAEITGEKEAVALTSKLTKAIRSGQYSSDNQATIPVTASVGVTLIHPAHINCLDALFAPGSSIAINKAVVLASQAMLKAKADGKNQIVFINNTEGMQVPPSGHSQALQPS